MKRYHVIVEGMVQGVGMRGFCMMQAQMRNLTGSVRNMSNGMVEIYVQGDEEAIDDFLTVVAKGSNFIHVTNMTVKEVPVKEDEKRFSYLW